MLKTLTRNYLRSRGTLAACTMLLLSPALRPQGREVPPGSPEASEARDRALVEQFFPLELSNQDAADAVGHHGRSSKEVAFLSADLDGSGRPDFLVALYRTRLSAAVRVLRRTGSSAVLVDDARQFSMGGMSPKLSLVDLDHSGRPAVVIAFKQNHGETTKCLLKWNGYSLASVGTWATDTAYDGSPSGYSLLNDAFFLDLDGDGILEIVNPPEFQSGNDSQKAPETYHIYRMHDGAYTLSTAFFDDFRGFLAGPNHMQGESFVASRPGTPYAVTIANGNGRDKPPVTGAEIRLNGELVAGADKINANSRYLTVPVNVKTENVITVNFTGVDGSELFIGIGPAAPPPGGSR